MEQTGNSMRPLRSARLRQSGNVCGSHGNQINIIVDGKTGSSLTNAGEVRGCEEVTGWTGSLALEVWRR